MNTVKNSKTFYLFTLPSFIEGMSRIFDFANSLPEYNYSKTSEYADYVAIKNDWDMVGNDLFDSFEIVRKIKNDEKKCPVEATE